MVKKKPPETIKDQELDQMSGGLLPAVKELEGTTSTETTASSHSGGANFAMGDGSVRFIR